MPNENAPRSGVVPGVLLNKTMLRIGNPDWGSKLIERGTGDVEVHCGRHDWGYSAQIQLGDIIRSLDRSHRYQIKVTLTLMKGDTSIGLLENSNQFTTEVGSFPKNEKVILPLPIDHSHHPDLTLMIRNGSRPNSVVRIHDIKLERSEQAKRAYDTRSADNVDEENADFWSELCGTRAAKQIGVTDSSPRSLKRFDDWFFMYYPYLPLHIPFTEMAGLDVLEVGLGYGTVSQRLAEWGARFTGLDISPGPVGHVNKRLRQAGLPGEAKVGSILATPFDDESFDRVVTIGCLHHTGDLAKSIEECWRVLRPGGQLILMVYNAFSFRRWMQARGATATLWLRERFGYRGVLAAEPGQRKSYDANKAGEEAPHIDFVSATSLRHMCRRFTHFSCVRENINQESPFLHRTRTDLLRTLWPRIGGADIYATATKTAWYRYSDT